MAGKLYLKLNNSSIPLRDDRKYFKRKNDYQNNYILTTHPF